MTENTIDLASVNFTPEAVEAYKAFTERIVQALIATDLAPDPKNIPDEQGRLESDGSLTIFVSLPNDVEVSMNVPKGHWAWRQ